MVKQSAFVFLKPHANTEKAREYSKKFFEDQNITVQKEGLITAEEIDSKQLIDNHYYAIASKATILTPDQLNVPKKMFSDKFSADWDETLKAGKIFNAKVGGGLWGGNCVLSWRGSGGLCGRRRREG